jgi:hypothetical protein
VVAEFAELIVTGRLEEGALLALYSLRDPFGRHAGP